MKPDVNTRAYVRVWTDAHLSHATQECDADILGNIPTGRSVVRWCRSPFVASRLERKQQFEIQRSTDIDVIRVGTKKRASPISHAMNPFRKTFQSTYADKRRLHRGTGGRLNDDSAETYKS